MAHVTKRRPQLARLAAGAPAAVQLFGIDQSQGDQHRSEGHGVQQEAFGDPDRRNHGAGERGADDPRRLDDHAIEAHRVHDSVAAD